MGTCARCLKVKQTTRGKWGRKTVQLCSPCKKELSKQRRRK